MDRTGNSIIDNKTAEDRQKSFAKTVSDWSDVDKNQIKKPDMREEVNDVQARSIVGQSVLGNASTLAGLGVQMGANTDASLDPVYQKMADLEAKANDKNYAAGERTAAAQQFGDMQVVHDQFKEIQNELSKTGSAAASAASNLASAKSALSGASGDTEKYNKALVDYHAAIDKNETAQQKHNDTMQKAADVKDRLTKM